MNVEPTSAAWLLVGYCVLILLASLAGGWMPMLIRLTHTRLQVATSFVAGMMLGVAMLHMLPHAWHEFASVDSAVRWLLAGFVVMFFIQRFFHFHHHDVPDEAPERSSVAKGSHENGHHGHHDHDHDHDHHHDCHPTLAHQSARHLSWSGAALGLSLHSLIDGIALAASVAAESRHASENWLLGLGTFMVIILHKPFDAMAIGTLMAAGGWSKAARHVVNFSFALAIPIGAVAFNLGPGEGAQYLAAALAFAAGTFLCIAASDLLPELQFHSHDRGKLSLALIGGLVFAALLGKVEGDAHGHADGDAAHIEHVEEAKPGGNPTVSEEPSHEHSEP